MKIIIGTNYRFTKHWHCANGLVLAAQGEIATLLGADKHDLTLRVRGENWTLPRKFFDGALQPTKQLTREQLVANFRLLTELSPRNDYAAYRGAVLELCEIVRQSEAKEAA